MISRLFNAALRLTSLGVKLLFTLFMGRYFGLADLGTYGLVAAFVAIAIPLLGFRLDYTVGRELVDAAPLDVARKIRDQLLIYGLTYLLLAVGLLGLRPFLPPLADAKLGFVVLILLISILESMATISATNLIALRRPVLSTVLFFIRGALWVFPVMALAYVWPEQRSAQRVLEWWLGGVGLSVLLTFYAWRHLPWGEAMAAPVDWSWVRTGLKRCFPMWLGSVALAGSNYTDRFVVEAYLNREMVGVASFYGSFVLAIGALLDSGIFAFVAPPLISLHRQGRVAEFRREIGKLTLHATLSAGVLALAIGLIIPPLGGFLGRQEFAAYAPVLWLMLLGTWLKIVSTGLYFSLYAQHRDRAIWTGNFLLLVATLICNIAFIPRFGFIGVGYSAVVSSLVIGVWRLICVLYPPAGMPGLFQQGERA